MLLLFIILLHELEITFLKKLDIDFSFFFLPVFPYIVYSSSKKQLNLKI